MSLASIVTFGLIPALTYFGYYILKPDITAPEVRVGGNHILFSKNSLKSRKTRLGCESRVSAVQIEVTSIKDQTKRFIELHNLHPTEILNVEVHMAYAYRYRSKESFARGWSSWSQTEFITIRDSPYSIPSKLSDQSYSSLMSKLQEIQLCNMLIVGKPSHGKSSFINTAFTTINRDWTQCTLTSSCSNRSITRRQKAYTLLDNKVVLYDLPGWEREHDLRLFQDLVQGKCSDLSLEEMKAGRYTTPKGQIGTKIDVVLFVISASYDDEDKELTEKIARELLASEVPFMVVLTKVDKLAPEGEEAITSGNFWQHPRVIKRCNEVQKFAAADSILPIMNYSCNASKDNAIDYITLQILTTAAKLAGK